MELGISFRIKIWVNLNNLDTFWVTFTFVKNLDILAQLKQ